jgi:hypothetical protein
MQECTSGLIQKAGKFVVRQSQGDGEAEQFAALPPEEKSKAIKYEMTRWCATLLAVLSENVPGISMSMDFADIDWEKTSPEIADFRDRTGDVHPTQSRVSFRIPITCRGEVPNRLRLSEDVVGEICMICSMEVMLRFVEVTDAADAVLNGIKGASEAIGSTIRLWSRPETVDATDTFDEGAEWALSFRLVVAELSERPPRPLGMVERKIYLEKWNPSSN